MSDPINNPAAAQAPHCPFCGVGWSDDMLQALERATVHDGCACCSDPAPANGHDPAAETIPPAEDIDCDSCGRSIFRAVTPSFQKEKPNG